jgi:hypothetical protein
MTVRPLTADTWEDFETVPRMQRSALLKPVDDEPVVSLACLLTKKDRRGEGLSAAWIAAVCDYLAETSQKAGTPRQINHPSIYHYR